MSTRDNTGTLYLIPVPLAAGALHTLSPEVILVLHTMTHFIVENARSARRFISATKPPAPINTLHIEELNKHGTDNPEDLLAPLFAGQHMGILSEAGCPGIADPGSALVQYAHRRGAKVVPLTGPSSILLALMASGLNGQQFHFHGYLSPRKDKLAGDLRRLEDLSRKEGSTQIFIETPYRNTQIVETALQVLADNTRFCIAVDLTSDNEWVRTLEIVSWRETEGPFLHKRPAVFCLQA